MYNAFVRTNVLFLCFLAMFSHYNTVEAGDYRDLNEIESHQIISFVEKMVADAEQSENPWQQLFQILDMFEEIGIDLKDHPEIFEFVFNTMSENGIEMTKDQFEDFKQYIRERHMISTFMHRQAFEPVYPSKKQPDFRINTVLGCVQIFGGVLLAIIPIPVVSSVGVGMIVSGVGVMLYDVSDQYKEQKSNATAITYQLLQEHSCLLEKARNMQPRKKML